MHAVFSLYLDHVSAPTLTESRGTNFNVIACDTFSVQDGKLKMVRTGPGRTIFFQRGIASQAGPVALSGFRTPG